MLPVPVHHGYDMRCLGYTTGQFREWISRFSHYAGNETSPHPVGTGRGHVFWHGSGHGPQARAGRSASGSCPTDRTRGRHGIHVQAGAELEFYLLDPQTGQPRDVGNDCYGLERAASFEHVLGPIRQQIDAIGIPIEQSNPEYAPGQVEVNMRYDSALLAADRVVMFRSLVKQLATRHGYLASFMAKPFIDLGGNGFHLHYSLWSEGQNIFSDSGRLNDTGRHFLGGLQKRMVETSICGAANVNSYRRRVPYSFCPTNASWGMDNRTVALRVIEGSDSATRVEKRDAGADCNPYLLMATDIAAGLDGIEEKQEPTEITTGDAYSDIHDEVLPTTLADAIRLARESDWLASVLGAAQLETWLQQAERELKFFSDQVTPFETDRYLRRF